MKPRDFMIDLAEVITSRTTLAAMVFFVGICSTEAADNKPPHPNILWLIVEDQSVDWNCYGVSAVFTPNINRFASEGTLYRQAFSTAPVCSASRSCFVTGVYQTSFGAHHHRSHRQGRQFPHNPLPLPAPIQHVSEYFRQAGYFTCNSDESLSRAGKEDYNFQTRSPWDGRNWNERAPGQPFYAQVNIKNLDHHGGYGHVDPSKVTLPPYHPDCQLTRAVWARYYERAQYYDQKVGEILEQLKKDELEGNTVVFLFGDNGRHVQRGMQYLYDGGIHVPLIVRWPGKLPAEQESNDLVSLIDLAPTSLSLAGIKPPQHMQGQTFLGPKSSKRKFVFAARDRMDETMDRIRCVRSARYKYIRNDKVWNESKRRPYTTWGPYFEVNRQSNMYKMHNYPILALLHVMHSRNELNAVQERFMVDEKPREELYDLIADPHEINNLADTSELADFRKEMSDALDDWIRQTGDAGQELENPAIADQWYNKILRPRHIKFTEKQPEINVDSSAEEYLTHWRSYYKLSN